MFGMSTNETKAWVTWAMTQFGLVCGLNFRWFPDGGRSHLNIGGRAFTEYGGLAWRNRIEISTLRDFTARDGFVAGGIIAHEIGHTYSRYNAPRMNHGDFELRDALMHPWGSRDDWFSPAEVVWLQKKHGKPVKRFWPHEITFLGKLLRDHTNRIRELIKQRDASRDKSFRAEATKEILLLRRHRRFFNARWKAKIALWEKVPYANVPKLNRPMGMHEAIKVLQAETECSSQRFCSCESDQAFSPIMHNMKPQN